MKFLVAVDGSAASRRALDYAIEIAREVDADPTVAHSVDPPLYAGTAPEPIRERSEADRLFVIERIDEAEARGEETLKAARARAEAEGVSVGDPVVTIADLAEEHAYDGIFVGHHGASERSEATFGSVAKELVTRARVPVTVVQ